MKIRYASAVLWLLSGVFVACGTVSNPFVHMKPDYSELDIDAMRQAALDIEKAIQAGDREPDIPDRDGIVLNTDLLRQSIRMRAARSECLNVFLDSGHAVEKHNGHVYIIRSKDYHKSTTRKQRDRDAQLIQGETTNRWAIYEEIIKASHFSSRSLSAIQELFHGARVECMTPGQMYENASAEIVPKKP